MKRRKHLSIICAFTGCIILLVLTSCSWGILDGNPTLTQDIITNVPTETPIEETAPTPTAAEDLTKFLPPILLNYYPKNGEVIAVDTPIVLEFSQSMNKESVAQAIDYYPKTDEFQLTFEWENERTLLLSPTESGFQKSTRYRILINKQALSQRGLNLTQEYEINFTAVSDLLVTATYPDAGAIIERADFPIQVAFSQSIVPQECVGKEIENAADCPSNILSITPAILGNGRWLQESLYEFNAHNNWTAGEKYRISVLPDIVSLADIQLNLPYTWEFSIIPPSISAVVPSENAENVEPEATIHVRFSTPMDREVTGKEFSVRSQNGDPVPGYVTWEDNGAQLLFQPVNPLDFDSTYFVKVGERSRAQSSSPLTDTIQWRFTTLPYPSVVNILPEDGTIFLEYDEPIRIQFAGAIEEESISTAVFVNPPLQSQQMQYDSTNTTLLISGDTTPQQEYCITILESIIDSYGNPLPESVVSCFTAGDKPAYFSIPFSLDTQVLPANQPSYLIFNNINTTSIDFKLISLSNHQFIRRDLSEADVIRQWQEVFPYSANDRQFSSVFLRQLRGALPAGMYALTWINGKNESEVVYLAVVDRNSVIKLALDKAIVWVTDITSGLPVSHTAVSLFNSSGDLIAGGTTDDVGLVQIPLQNIGNVWDVITAVVGVPGDGGFGVAQTSWNSLASLEKDNITFSGGPFTEYKGFVWVDHPVYKPGDFIHYYGYLFDKELVNYQLSQSQEALDIHLLNYDGKSVFETETTVSETGYFEGYIVLDDLLQAGKYTVSVQVFSADETGFTSDAFSIGRKANGGVAIDVDTEMTTAKYGDVVPFFVTIIDPDNQGMEETRFMWQVSVEEDIALSEGLLRFDDAYQYTWHDTYDLKESTVVTSGFDTTNIYGQSVITIPIQYIPSAITSTLPGQQLWRIQVWLPDGMAIFPVGESVLRVTQTSLHLGVRTNRKILELGDQIAVDILALNELWEPLANQPLTITLSKAPQLVSFDSDGPVEEETDKTNSVVTDERGIASAVISPNSGGEFIISAKMLDAQDNVIKVDEHIWVSGTGTQSLNEHPLNLLPKADKPVYQIGDTAQILLPINYEGSYHVLVTIEREKILFSEIVRVEGSNPIIAIPIQNTYAPRVYASFTVVNASDLEIIQSRTGYLALEIQSPDDQLVVNVTTDQEEYLPGDQALIRIRVTDPDMLPIDTEVSVTIQPQETSNYSFSKNFRKAVSVNYNLRVASGDASRLLPYTYSNTDTAEYLPIYTVMSFMTDTQATQHNTYPDTHLVQSLKHLAVNGEVLLTVDIPNTTQNWLVSVVATSRDGQFGTGEDEIAVSTKVSMETLLPRVYVMEDRSEITTILTNQTPVYQNVSITFDPINAIQLYGDDTLHNIDIPPFGRRSVSWPVYIPLSPSTSARFLITVSGDDFHYSYQPGGDEGIPVYPKNTITTFSSGILDDIDKLTEVIHVPRSSTNASRLTLYIEDNAKSLFTSGLAYIREYRVANTDVVVDRLVSTIGYLQYFSNEFSPEGSEDISAQSDIISLMEILNARQNDDGGWGWWQGDSNLDLSTYVTYGLIQAIEAGYPAKEENLYRASVYISSSISDTISVDVGEPSLAFALYILSLLDLEWPANSAALMYTNRDLLDISGKAYLALALHSKDSADTRIETLVNEIKESANYNSSNGVYWFGNSMFSDIVTTSTVFDMVLNLDTEFPELKSIAHWLTSNRQAKHWSTPHETALALNTLAKYYKITGIVESSYDWSFTFNDELLVDSHTKPITDSTYENTLGLIDTDDPIFIIGENRLEYSRELGLGILYYATKLDIALQTDDVLEINRGISINKEYCQPSSEKSVNNGLIRTECFPVTDINKDDILEVRLTVNLPETQYGLTIDDVYPAGFVPVDEIAEGRGLAGKSQPFATQLCDEIRCMIFSDVLSQGIYQVSYLIKASIPGEYHTIPAVLYEYDKPDLRVYSDSKLITIIDK